MSSWFRERWLDLEEEEFIPKWGRICIISIEVLLALILIACVLLYGAELIIWHLDSQIELWK